LFYLPVGGRAAQEGSGNYPELMPGFSAEELMPTSESNPGIEKSADHSKDITDSPQPSIKLNLFFHFPLNKIPKAKMNTNFQPLPAVRQSAGHSCPIVKTT
jgi:hypothetical protein